MGVIEGRIEGDARVVVSGELDLATASQLTSAVESLVTTDGQRVVVDLAAVGFMDSRGVSALCLAKAELEATGAVMVLGPTSPQVDATLSMVGLGAGFEREVTPTA